MSTLKANVLYLCDKKIKSRDPFVLDLYSLLKCRVEFICISFSDAAGR